jgi:tRNA threonylcarbamoyladenosine biosynthesis protein TsaB
MSVILCLETATTVCSVAIFAGKQLLGYQEYRIDKSHSSLLPTIIDTTLHGLSLSKADLTAVAVSEGPGSYTGLRIGTSIAKGLCYALEIPLLSVNTLHAMAAEVNKFNTRGAFLCPMIDARRMEVYACVINSEGGVEQETAPHIIDEHSFSEYLKKHEVWFFGNGSDKCKELIGKNANAVFISDMVPSAKSMGELACEQLQSSSYKDLAYFEPFYLKEFRATKPKSVS